ncbi:MAG: hypothetical protein V1752_06485 [Candidatus Firestonebacteria bacterium]
MLFKILIAVIVFVGGFSGQNVSGTTSTVAALPDLKPQLEEQGKEISQVKAAQEKLENSYKELSAKYEALFKSNFEILTALKAFEADMKSSGEKLASSEKNIESLKVKLDLESEEIAALNKKAEADKLILTGLKTQTESFKVKLDIARDDIKVRSDEIKALKDAFSILRGNINSNISDTIELKNAVNEIKAKESGKPAEGIMAWEYLGIVTSGVAVLALVLSIVK